MILKRIIIAFVILFLLPVSVFAQGLDIHGFIEMDYGAKLSDDTTKNDSYNMAEARLQLQLSHYFSGENYLADKGSAINLKADFLVDGYYSGKTSFDLREANFVFTPWDFMDVKAGRQTLTWGTGDYLFINDQFPKDFESFFMGRDDEYLKKPSDALKTSFYPKLANIDFIWIPYVTSNTLPKGDRLSFFDSFQGGISGTESDRDIIEPAFKLSNSEYTMRIYKNLGSNEVAFYYFRGFNKNPQSYKNEAARQLYHERRDVYGGSLRGPFADGVGNVEFGYNYSREDPDGKNRMIENSHFEAMAGYEKDLGSDFKVGFQYLLEQKLDYSNYQDNLLPNDYRWDEFRHVLTNRITKLYMNQTLRISLFTFWSPSDNDGYVRPSASYDITDQWKTTLGANLPWGEDEHTFFGQMKRNKNVYLRVRYAF